MSRYIKIAIVMAMLTAAFSSCKSSSCGCDSFGEVVKTQATESVKA